jgi:hypothetical protein
LLALSFSFSQYLGLCVFFTLLLVIKLIKEHWHGSRHISVIINETYKFNFQPSLIKFIILINRIKQKQYILLLSRLMCKKKMFEQKRFAGRHFIY